MRDSLLRDRSKGNSILQVRLGREGQEVQKAQEVNSSSMHRHLNNTISTRTNIPMATMMGMGTGTTRDMINRTTT